MLFRKDNLKRRTELAEKTINSSPSEKSVKLFIEHHLEEIEPEFWNKHCGTSTPSVQQVLELIEFKRSWGDEHSDNMDFLDFTLPDETTDYVISVEFDKRGKVLSINMES